MTRMAREEIPQLGISFMDRTHEEEVDIYNDLISLVEKYLSSGVDADSNAIVRQLERWIEHTEQHFEREQELMESTAFHSTLVHAGEHGMALKLMEQVLDHWIQNRDSERLQYFMFELWPDWFRSHVSKLDRSAAEHALQQGYSET